MVPKGFGKRQCSDRSWRPKQTRFTPPTHTLRPDLLATSLTLTLITLNNQNKHELSHFSWRKQILVHKDAQLLPALSTTREHSNRAARVSCRSTTGRFRRRSQCPIFGGFARQSLDVGGHSLATANSKSSEFVCLCLSPLQLPLGHAPGLGLGLAVSYAVARSRAARNNLAMHRRFPSHSSDLVGWVGAYMVQAYRADRHCASSASAWVRGWAGRSVDWLDIIRSRRESSSVSASQIDRVTSCSASVFTTPYDGEILHQAEAKSDRPNLFYGWTRSCRAVPSFPHVLAGSYALTWGPVAIHR